MDTSKSQTFRFVLYREQDISGVSTQFISAEPAVVAEGTLLSNGRVALTWLSPMITVAAYDGMDVVQALHGHNGATKVHWIDEPPTFVDTQIYYRVFTPEPAEHSIEQGEITVSYCTSSNQALARAIPLVMAKFPGCIIQEIALLDQS